MAYNITDDISRMLEMGQREIFTKNFDMYPTEWTSFCTRKQARKRSETYDSMGNLKAAEIKPEGGPINYGKVLQAYQSTITNQTIANGYAHSMEAIKYDLYGVINSIKAKELARTMREYEEETAIYWIDNIATVNLADGVPLASDSKPLIDSALLNDTLATAGDIADPDVHKTAMNMFYDFMNHAGKPMRSRASNGLTHCKNQFTIEEVYKSINKAQEMSNTKNVLPQISWSYSTYQSDENSFVMWDRNFEHIIFQWFMGTEYEHDKDKVFTKNMYFNSIAIYNTGALPNIGIVYNAGV